MRPSFDEVYAARYTELVAQIQSHFGDRQDAHDVVQEAFYRALVRWDTISSYDDPAAWIRRVAWNLAVSRWRKARTALGFLHRQRRVEPQSDGPGPDRVTLLAALGKLPAAHRRAIVLHYLEDVPVAEIAAREGVATGTVKSWLHRGRAALAATLAVVFVLAVAGLIAVLRPQHDSAPPVAPSPSHPSVDDATERVAAAVGIDDLEEQGLGGIAVLDPGDGRFTTSRNLIGGRYDVKMVCVGEGSVRFTIGAAAASVVCDIAQTTVLTLPVRTPDPGAIMPVTVTPQVTGSEAAVFGYLPELREDDRTRQQDAALAMLPDDGLSAESFFMGNGSGSEDWTVEPGRYRIHAACVGFGTATLVVGQATTGATPARPESVEVPCGQKASLDYDLTAAGLSTQLEPDEEATGSSAGAIVVSKIS
ncbi:hypothetical protein ACTI_26380 [Actinoplanes sp. OR16]|nr:hypothetical protein ACTI_26380 [Actinoplanes sp. OR16]